MSEMGGDGAPVRLPIKWQDESFCDEASLDAELERVFDICHSCRRCVNLCKAFPTLFDLVDESETMEVDGVDKADYDKVVKDCYLCDLCYMTKCPYVPPHEWNVDFPHLMLRAKIAAYKKNGRNLRDKLLGCVDEVGKMATLPGMNRIVNRGIRSRSTRRIFKIHPAAELPRFGEKTFRKLFKERKRDMSAADQSTQSNHRGHQSSVALFVSCYGNYNMPEIVEKLCAVLEHNNIAVTLADKERCCGMPKLEQGNLDEVIKMKEYNIPPLFALVESGIDIIAPVPSCVLMFKQELPLLFPDDEQVRRVAEHIHDPTAWLLKLEQSGALNKDFKNTLGHVAYHAACHTRVQNVGLKTRKMLELVPETEVTVVERCSGHDGTYAIKDESYEKSVQIARPAAGKIDQIKPDYFTSDCVLAGKHIANVCDSKVCWEHPLELLGRAYGL